MASIKPGVQLGRYEILSEVGKGGMSVVYRARDLQLQRDVAVKVLHDFLMTDAAARTRFHREAMSVARLKHPHIIDIYDYSGEDAELDYIVTELVDGCNLGRLIESGEVCEPEVGLLIARPIADALAHAHDEGIIHRDLKPENILIGQDGRLMLTDFGIARTVDNATMTVTGTLLGSPAYMAPEYIEGRAVDERVDVFAFGAMLYQMLTGELPFQGPTPAALLLSITTGNYRPPNEVNPNIHQSIVDLVVACMAINPQRRIQTMPQVRDKIDAILLRIDIENGGREELEQALCSTQEFSAQLRSRLGADYTRLGKAALAQGDTPSALNDFDRALSIDPSNEEVHRFLRRIQRNQWLRRTVLASAVVVCFGAVVWAGMIWWLQQEPASTTPNSDVAVSTPIPAPPAPPLPLAELSDTASAAEPDSPSDDKRNVTLLLEGTGDLYIDEKLVRPNVAGSVAMLLSPGSHTLSFRNGKNTANKIVDIPADGAVDPIGLKLESTNASRTSPVQLKTKAVTFKTAGAWVNVELNGKLVAKNKMGRFALELPYGKHTLRFTNDKAQPREEELVVSDKTPPAGFEVMIPLQPKDGRLLLKGAPNGAVVVVAGKRRLVTELTKGDPIMVPLKQGRGSTAYEVTIQRGTKIIKKTVVFKPGEEHVLAVDRQDL